VRHLGSVPGARYTHRAVHARVRISRARLAGPGRRGRHEADVPTQQPQTQEDSRVPPPHADQGRSCRPRPAPREGPDAHRGVSGSASISFPFEEVTSPGRNVPRARPRWTVATFGRVPGGAPAGRAARRKAAGSLRFEVGRPGTGRFRGRPQCRWGRPSEPGTSAHEGGLAAHDGAGIARDPGGLRRAPRDRWRRSESGRFGHGTRAGRGRGIAAVIERSRRLLRIAGWPLRSLLVGVVRAYRVSVGQFVGGRCRFYPSCSAYAEEAIGHLGFVRGGALSVWRIMRCNPFGAGGFDYPPGHTDLLLRYDTVLRAATPTDGVGVST